MSDFDTLVKEKAGFRAQLNEFIANTSAYMEDTSNEPWKVRDEILKLSFEFHYNNNAFYKNLCMDQDVTPELVREKGPEIIPGIPIKLFKSTNSHKLLTVPLDEVEFELRSTGTSGIPSVSRRDRYTIDTLTMGLTSLYRDFFQVSNGCGLFLCPSPAEVPEMGMVKAFNFLCGLLDDREYLVERYTFKSEEAYDVLKSWEDRFDRYIVGPPFMIHRFLRYLEKNDIKMQLDEGSNIIMLGGWKRFTGEQISRDEFDNLCIKYLGVKKEQIRDMYGLVECDFLAMECDQNKKHIPQWIKMIPKTIDESKEIITNSDSAGQITILDPTCFAYPCFIETEDVAFIDPESVCECGRNTQRMEFLRRIEGAELGCCAINMEKSMDGDGIIKECELVL